MGTVGIVGYKYMGKSINTYNHFDSYPSALGMEVIKEIKKINDWERFRNNFNGIKIINSDYITSKDEIESSIRWYDSQVGYGKKNDPYCLLRHLQGSIQIPSIYEGQVSMLIDGYPFDGYSYILNLDDEMLEFYEEDVFMSEFPFSCLPNENDSLYLDFRRRVKIK